MKDNIFWIVVVLIIIILSLVVFFKSKDAELDPTTIKKSGLKTVKENIPKRPLKINFYREITGDWSGDGIDDIAKYSVIGYSTEDLIISLKITGKSELFSHTFNYKREPKVSNSYFEKYDYSKYFGSYESYTNYYRTNENWINYYTNKIPELLNQGKVSNLPGYCKCTDFEDSYNSRILVSFFNNYKDGFYFKNFLKQRQHAAIEEIIIDKEDLKKSLEVISYLSNFKGDILYYFYDYSNLESNGYFSVYHIPGKKFLTIYDD